MLEAKIFKPYFLTNSTIVEYQHKQARDDNSGGNVASDKLSLFEILEHNFLKSQASSSTVTRLYFQIPNEEEEVLDKNSSQQRNSNAPTNKSMKDDYWPGDQAKVNN
mmetsp:Transcript_12464/g.19484  ORF Transcript_12464/g.19484 Transcript_12464/m.19484 type:complete len:107 (+) Transcript_12464:181-501(+)